MNEVELPDIYEAALRAAVNQRCAAAHAHDIRGTLQALVGAVELLCRSTRAAGADPRRTEKACELARRAVSHHERAMMELFQLLTFQPTEPVTADPDALVDGIVHLLRNEAGARQVVIRTQVAAGVNLPVERGRLHALLTALVAAAIDASPPGAELDLSIARRDGLAIIALASFGGCSGRGARSRWLPEDLAFIVARQFMSAHGGRLEVDSDEPLSGTMRLCFPCAMS